MTLHVLVAHGTTNGSTAEIAHAVAEVLREEGLTVTEAPAGEVIDVNPYGAVVVGGALYNGRWHKGARRLLRRHDRALARRPLWLFSSGPLDESAAQRDIPPVPWVRHAAARLDVREHVTFGGCLHDGAHGFVARMILRSGKGGDFRDYTAIRAWASRVAKEIKAIPVGAGMV